MAEVVFLKLGGSLITDKQRRYTPLLNRLDSIAIQIARSRRDLPELQLVLGHGSGSFGHFAVQEHLTPQIKPAGVQPGPQRHEFWQAVSEVQYRASELNRLVMEALHRADVAAVSLPPSATALASAGRIAAWNLSTLEEALSSGLLPVIFGDILFDVERGASVVSTETLMFHLAGRLPPQRVLLAGIERAVWADYPERRRALRRITPSIYGSLASALGGSHGTDVTGGMKGKVEQMLDLVAQVPGLEVQIFSGIETGNVGRALAGEALGTVLASD